MNAKQKLLEALENLSWHKDTDTIFQEMYDAANDYMRKTTEFSLDNVFQEIVHISTAEQMAIDQIENNGLVGVVNFLNNGECELSYDYYRVSPYGYLENIDKSTLERIVESIKKRLEDLDEGDEEND